MRHSSHDLVGGLSLSEALRPLRPKWTEHWASTGLALPESSAGSARLQRFSDIEDPLPVALSYALETYSTEADEMPAGVGTFATFGDACHYRLDFAHPYGVGHNEFCGLADGFFVQLSNVTYGAPYAMTIAAPDILRVRIASDGDCEYATAGEEGLDLKGPGASIIIEPAGAPPAQAGFGAYHNAVNILIHRETLQRLYAQGEQELPAAVQAFIAGTLQQTVAKRLPLSPALLRCLEDLQSCDLEGHSRRLFIRSKAVEIFCHAFKALGEDDSFGSTEASSLTTRGVLKAQRLLMENFVTPPSLDDLAHEVGLSRSNLCAGFRQIVGQTVYDYVADLRMRHALSMLNQRDASITQIAYAVGYSHPSSFSLAVQRRFGATPSELRRRGLPVI